MEEQKEPAPVEKKAEAKKAEVKKEAEPKTVSDALQITQIALDTYDDIFSDFDPSPYETRILSDDFLNELRKRYAERKKGEFVVNFTLPHSSRSQKTEALVKKRIKDYFKAKLKSVEKDRKESVKKGILWFAGGLAVSLCLLLIPQLDSVPAITILSVLTWFLLWTGYERLFEESPRLTRKRAFYGKFMRAEFNFVDQEQVVRYISSSYR